MRLGYLKSTAIAVFCVLVPAFMHAGEAVEPAVTLPQTVVTAQKSAGDPLELPVSVTAVPINSGWAELRKVKEASEYVPGVFVNEFSARALSNPFFRGVGGSPANPGVTTYMDGVPQLNSYSSNIELMDVERVEFVRGPQGALFGRNTPGGLINIVSARPSQVWTGHAEAGYGNYASKDLRAGVSGPIQAEELSLSLAGGYADRQGFTRNSWNGEDVDSREGIFGKAQALFSPSEEFEVRLILTGERDRDGDYALGDLDSIRQHPHEVTRDFTDGYNDRDVLAPTLIAESKGESLDMTSTSGFVHWENDGLTDLDYGYTTPQHFFPNAIRRNQERQNQFTQEFRLSSAEDSPIRIADGANLAWQGGLFFFYRNYDQETTNNFAVPLAAFSGSSESELEDFGLGFYGQARLDLFEKLELSLGARVDFEQKEAELASSTSAAVEHEDSFSEVSPQLGLSYKITGNQVVYAAIAAGYKAGGFNPPPAGLPAPDGTQTYGAEHSWNYEAGYKARGLDGKVQGSVALFYIDWDDLQLNQQYPGSAGQFYIGNAGAAMSKGIEFEVVGRPLNWFDLFGSAAFLDSEFLAGSTAFNANLGINENVGGNQLPYAPEFTASAGAEARWILSPKITLFLRGQVTGYGEFEYDASNAEVQDAYAIAGFRGGIRSRNWFIEGWAANAFDAEYVPIAIPYGQLGAPSGYVGENGAPATFGARIGLFF